MHHRHRCELQYLRKPFAFKFGSDEPEHLMRDARVLIACSHLSIIWRALLEHIPFCAAAWDSFICWPPLSLGR
ncbi:hypothetical protein CEXT_624661 [Caerostris extrusa]|uniref:Uncharacterized protein n=1 Tax=Caerostris extrusa TaxID=172846 RepID=A0AAV4PSW4_CAEEX|nr:hypothetical protein CEXT_624661 [Caerostris extrusa]